MNIPEKYFYTIGDVCKLTGTKPHILRYWESQFKLLRPARRYSGHRKYTQRDLDLIQKIKHLIIDRRFTLAGAKKEILRQMNAKSPSTTPIKSIHNVKPDPAPNVSEIKRDIDECLNLLKNEERQPELLQI